MPERGHGKVAQGGPVHKKGLDYEAEGLDCEALTMRHSTLSIVPSCLDSADVLNLIIRRCEGQESCAGLSLSKVQQKQLHRLHRLCRMIVIAALDKLLLTYRFENWHVSRARIRKIKQATIHKNDIAERMPWSGSEKLDMP